MFATDVNQTLFFVKMLKSYYCIILKNILQSVEIEIKIHIQSIFRSRNNTIRCRIMGKLFEFLYFLKKFKWKNKSLTRLQTSDRNDRNISNNFISWVVTASGDFIGTPAKKCEISVIQNIRRSAHSSVGGRHLL